jgi:hypothetical protein
VTRDPPNIYYKDKTSTEQKALAYVHKHSKKRMPYGNSLKAEVE